MRAPPHSGLRARAEYVTHKNWTVNWMETTQQSATICNNPDTREKQVAKRRSNNDTRNLKSQVEVERWMEERGDRGLGHPYIAIETK